MTDNKSLKFTRGTLFDMMIDVDSALERFYTLANRAALTGDYGAKFYHPAFAKAHFVQDLSNEDLKNAYSDFARQLERNGFTIENTQRRGEGNLWITWLK